MPKKYIRCVKGISKKLKRGLIPKYYYENGKRKETSPYAICRKATGYYGTSHNIGLLKSKKENPNNLKKDYRKLKLQISKSIKKDISRVWN